MSIRQNRIENVIQEVVAQVLQRNAREYCLGAMVTPTIVRVTPDLSLARIYLSIFAGPTKEEVLQNINQHKSKIQCLESSSCCSNIEFRIDDSLDYAEKIDELLKS